MNTNFLRSFFLSLVAACGLVGVNAFALDAPTERVILTVTGAIDHRNAGSVARFDMKMIEALPQHSFTTRTPWFDKPVRFTGPLLADVMAAVGARGSTLLATAINDYTITIPMTDVMARKVIMARLIDGQPIPIREKGPLFIVYPFDSDVAFRSSTFYERSIWQLKSLDVRP